MGLDNQDYFLTVAEVSTVLKLSVITIYKYIKGNKLQAVEFGGHYRISQASLDSFIKSHLVSLRKAKEDHGS